jgi:hypothetical protein
VTGGTPGEAAAELTAADEQLIRELTERARAEGLQLSGPGGLLGHLTKRVIEGALNGEMDDHLGYSKHDPDGRNGGKSRNGHREGPCSPAPARWRSACRGTGTPASARRSPVNGSGGSPAPRIW